MQLLYFHPFICSIFGIIFFLDGNGNILLNSILLLKNRVVPESPRLLLIKGKREQAFKIFKKIADSNKKEFEIDSLKELNSNINCNEDGSRELLLKENSFVGKKVRF